MPSSIFSIPFSSETLERRGFHGDENLLATELEGEGDRHSSKRGPLSSKMFPSFKLLWSHFGNLFSLEGVTCFLKKCKKHKVSAKLKEI